MIDLAVSGWGVHAYLVLREPAESSQAGRQQSSVATVD
jgi:hypothetical protein